MPRVIWSAIALADLRRVHRFLKADNLQAADRARDLIRAEVQVLGKFPLIGRVTDEKTVRELIIPHGRSAYLILYRQSAEAVLLLALRHGREVSYSRSTEP